MKKIKTTMQDKVCELCGKSYEEWESPNFCRGCRTCKFNITREEFLKRKKL